MLHKISLHALSHDSQPCPQRQGGTELTSPQPSLAQVDLCPHHDSYLPLDLVRLAMAHSKWAAWNYDRLCPIHCKTAWESIYFLATTDNLFEHSIAGLLSHVKSHITLLESSRYSRCGTCLHQTSLLRSGPSFQLANLFVGPALPFHMLGFPPRFLPSKLFAVLRAWSICSHHWVNPSWALFTPWKSFSNFSSSSTFLFCRLDTPTDLLKQNNRAILYSQTLLLCAYTIYNPIHNVLAILDGRPVIQSLAPKIQMFGFGVR